VATVDVREVIVLDTNVLVSALSDSFRPAARILDLVLGGYLVVAYDDRILAEWWKVLRREKFGFDAEDVETLLGFVEGEGLRTSAPPLPTDLPDLNAAPFLEVAIAANAVYITEDARLRHLTTNQGVVIVDPATFLGGGEWRRT
jgi:predicted nucleic acid-binding protein